DRPFGHTLGGGSHPKGESGGTCQVDEVDGIIGGEVSDVHGDITDTQGSPFDASSTFGSAGTGHGIQRGRSPGSHVGGALVVDVVDEEIGTGLVGIDATLGIAI